MPIKRRTPKNRDHAITPEAIEAYRRGDKTALHRALGLKPWMASPLHGVGPCPWPKGTAGETTWPLIIGLRAELEEASK